MSIYIQEAEAALVGMQVPADVRTRLHRMLRVFAFMLEPPGVSFGSFCASQLPKR